MPSFLDILVSRNNPRVGGLLGMGREGELLRENARQNSLLSGADAPTPTPSLFNPNPQGRQSPNLRQLQGTAELAGAPPAAAADPIQLQGAADNLRMQAINARKQEIGGFLTGITGREELSAGQRRWVEETVDGEDKSGGQPGNPGAGFFARLFLGQTPPGLTDAQRKSAVRQGMLTAGLGTLMSDRRGLAGLAEGLTYGIMAAKGVTEASLQAAQDAGERLNKEQGQADAWNLYSDFKTPERSDLETWRAVHEEAGVRNMPHARQAAEDVISFLSELPSGQAERKPVPGALGLFHDGQGNVYDVDGKRVSTDDPRLQPEPDPVRGTVETVDGRRVLLDPTSGQVIRDLGPAGAGGPDEGETFQRTNSLADDFRQETGEIQESIALGSAAPNAGDNSAGDLRLIFVFNKLIDPGSRITEGEVRAGKNLGGMNAQARGFYDRMAEGRLPPAAREELENEISNMMESRSQQLSEVAEQYRERAQRFGVNPEFVVRRGLIPDLSPEGGGGGGNSPIRGSDVDAELDEIFGAGGS